MVRFDCRNKKKSDTKTRKIKSVKKKIERKKRAYIRDGFYRQKSRHHERPGPKGERKPLKLDQNRYSVSLLNSRDRSPMCCHSHLRHGSDLDCRPYFAQTSVCLFVDTVLSLIYALPLIIAPSISFSGASKKRRIFSILINL